MIDSLKQWARALKRDVVALSLAVQDPRVSWYIKILAIGVVGYALSPIDLIPDFIPVLGYLDDLVLLPLGILFVIKLMPPALMAEHREAAKAVQKLPVNKVAAFVIVGVWAICAVAGTVWISHVFEHA